MTKEQRSQPTVLFVDDDPNVTAALKRSLRREPYRIFSASCADEGLRVLAKQPIDVLVTDEDMPGMPGTEFLAQVRRRYPRIIRIMLTGRADLESTLRVAREGWIYRFFTKPCNDIDLGLSIRQALQQRDLLELCARLLERYRGAKSGAAGPGTDDEPAARVDEEALEVLRPGDLRIDPEVLLGELASALGEECRACTPPPEARVDHAAAEASAGGDPADDGPAETVRPAQASDRVRQLECLNAVAAVLACPVAAEDILQEVARLVPNAWPKRGQVRARLTVGERQYRSAAFDETEWIQTASAAAAGASAISLAVFRQRAPGPAGEIGSEEGDRHLLDAVLAQVEAFHQRIQSDEALRQSEARYREYLHHQSDGIIITDPEDRVVYANPAAHELFEVPLGEFDGRAITEFAPDADLGTLAQENRLRREGQRSSHEMSICTSWGGERFLLVTAEPWRDDKGNYVGAFGVFRDMTHRKIAAQKLERRLAVEETLVRVLTRFLRGADLEDMLAESLAEIAELAGAERAHLFQVCPERGEADCVYRWDGSGSARPPDEEMKLSIQGVSWFFGKLWQGKAVVVEDARELPEEAATERETLAQRGVRGVATFPVIVDDNVFGFVSFETVSDSHRWEEGDEVIFRLFAGILGSAYRRRRNEERMLRLTTAVEQSAEAVLVTDPDGAIEYVNPAFERITGYTSAEVVGNYPKVLKSGHHDEAFYREMWETILRGEVWSGRITNRRMDGSLYDQDSSISPVIDKRGEITHFVAMMRDVSREQQMEAQLRQAQKLEAIGQLAAGIAHEINTPTQFIGDNVRFLQDGFRDLGAVFKHLGAFVEDVKNDAARAAELEGLLSAVEEADMEYLSDEIPLAISQSLEGVTRVSNIVQAMKEFSHPGASGKSSADINKAIQNTVTVSRSEWKYAAEVELELDPELPLVPCFLGDVNQVVLNLISNAAHAIAETAEGNGEEKGRIRIETRAVSEHAEIIVSDNGTGVPDGVKERIFDPFFTTKEVGKGTGQGLAIARNIVVDKHGGELLLETTPGEGSVFTIRLPLDAEAEDGPAAPEA